MTLLELLQLLRKKWQMVVAFPVVFALAAAGYCWGFMTNDYTATVSVYVLTKSSSESVGTISSSDTTASQQLANDVAVLATSSRVLNGTAEALGMSSLDGYDIEVSSDTTTRVISLSVTSKRPEAAAAVANELANQTADAGVEVMDLRAVNVVDTAEVPQVPSGPNRWLYTAVAFLAGLFVAVAIAVIQDMVDTTVKSSEEAEELFGLPVLGRIPSVKKMR